MSIAPPSSSSSPIPVLQGDRGTELRSTGEELLLRRPDAELRIPLAAIARVHAERRDLSVELTAPTGAEPTLYRITDVSAAAASVFAEAVNAALPERSAGEATVDGSTLVVHRSLLLDDEEEEDADEHEVPVGLRSPNTWPAYACYAAVGALAVAVGLLDGNWGRGIATLLLGEVGVGITLLASGVVVLTWKDWYLPRYGITVDAQQIYRDGETTNTFTATDGVTRHISGDDKGRPVRVAYHPRNPMTAVVLRTGWQTRVGELVLALFVLTLAALAAYGTYRLCLPAFT
ncbi:hypothetical protein ACIQUQ_20795 [Streptomyces sp. NPDC101118]|uniref:hypothetical protein n=1 Tax=Streptomyces sp. NPDC101118 TaxID=3366109 RepID=UPI00381F77E7